MAVRYGVPVSEFLGRHTSSELTELMAYFDMQANPQSAPKAAADPEEQSRLLKQALFKGK